MHSKLTQYRSLNLRGIQNTRFWDKLDSEYQHSLRVVARVLPFRTNEYVLRELIDWHNIPDDPIFQLTFPQREMLDNLPLAAIIVFTTKY